MRDGRLGLLDAGALSKREFDLTRDLVNGDDLSFDNLTDGESRFPFFDEFVKEFLRRPKSGS